MIPVRFISPRSSVIAGAVLLAAITRLIPHPPNFAATRAAAISKRSMVIPLARMENRRGRASYNGSSMAIAVWKNPQSPQSGQRWGYEVNLHEVETGKILRTLKSRPPQ
jgi:hypothetical protein